MSLLKTPLRQKHKCKVIVYLKIYLDGHYYSILKIYFEVNSTLYTGVSA